MQTQLGLHFVPFPGLSSSGDQVFGERGCWDLSPPPSLPVGFLGVQPAHLLRQMLTVQNPKKSWLAMKPACSLVDDASLGPWLPPSGSGCPHLPVSTGDGLVRSRLALVTPLFLWAGPNPVWPRHCKHTRVLFFVVSVPPHSTTEQVNLKKCPPPPPCVRAEIRHWRDQQTEAKTEGTSLEVTGATD